MTKKHTYEFVKNEFLIRGCELLESEYINNNIKMKYRCKCNNISKISYNHFKQGSRCKNCKINAKKHSYEFIKNEFLIHGCELLETEYISSKTKMKYICNNGHITTTIFNSFQQGKRCSKCCRNELLKFEYVFNYFKNNNCTLLETEYINSSTKMKYLCKNNHKTSITFNSFRKGSRCGKCHGNEKLTYEFVKNEFEINEYTLLEIKYINNNTKMKYLCKNNHTTSITFNNFQSGYRCGICKNKTEVIVLKYLENNYKNIIFQPSFEWCKKEKKLPFDFLLNDIILIECDGRQHFSQVSNWNSPDFNLKNDIYKSNLAINNGYKIIRIFQEDVYNNKFNWQELLKESIKFLNNSDEYIIYLSTNKKLYNKHKFELTKQILEDKLSKLKL